MRPSAHSGLLAARNRIVVARYNLLTYTEIFSNSVWDKFQNTVTSDSQVAPTGATTADTFTSGGSECLVLQSLPDPGNNCEISIYAKAGSNTWISLSNNAHFVFFDVVSGSVGTAQDGTTSIASAGNGWYRCIWRPTSGANCTNIRIRLASANGNAGGTTSLTGYFWGASATTAANAGRTYQRVGASTDWG